MATLLTRLLLVCTLLLLTFSGARAQTSPITPGDDDSRVTGPTFPPAGTTALDSLNRGVCPLPLFSEAHAWPHLSSLPWVRRRGAIFKLSTG